MDLAQATNSLWSIHRSFQSEDNRGGFATEDDDEASSIESSSDDDLYEVAHPAPSVPLDQLPLTASRLWNITERMNETDCDTATEADDGSDAGGALVSPPLIHSLLTGPPTDTTSRTTTSSLYRPNEDGTDGEDSDDGTDGGDDERLIPPANYIPTNSASVLGLQSPTSLDFQPRLQDPEQPLLNQSFELSHSVLSVEEEDMLSPAPSFPMGSDLEFQEDQPPRAKDDAESRQVQTCFDKVQLVSPSFFQSPAATENVVSNEETSNAKDRSLSLFDLVQPIDPEFFREETPRQSRKSPNRSSLGPESGEDASEGSMYYSTVSTASNHRSPTAVFHLDQYTIENDKDHQPSRLSSSFKSATRKNRVVYSLSGGKRAMSRSHRLYSRSYLPPSRSALPLTPVVTPEKDGSNSVSSNTSPTSFSSNEEEERIRTETSPHRSGRLADTALHILLVELKQKVFEIVKVDHATRETTVGDVLSRARVQATDPLLSQQTYLSLCNSTHELAAPMLPVNLMVTNDTNHDVPKKKKKQQKTKEKLLQKYDEREIKEHRHDDPSMGRLLVAVPEGSSASEVRKVQRVLWKHPRLQRWWKKQQKEAM